MATLTSTGVGSGLDVNTIVTSLMSVEKRPLQMLQTAGSTIQSRMSAFGTLKSQLANLGDVAARLAATDAWNPAKVDSGNASAVTATATASATPGQHTVKITRLAQSQVLASAPFAASTTVVGTGTLTLETGTTVGGVFTPAAGKAAVSIPIDAAHQTLAGVRDAINAAKAGVTASIVTDSGGARLVLRGADGAASTLRLRATDADGTDADAAGLSALAWDPAATAGAGRNLTQTQAAQDAAFEIDGLALTSATNTATGVLEGVTLTLRQVTTEPFGLTVSTDTTALRKNVTDFVNAYNALNNLVTTQTHADATAAKRGVLVADSTARGVLQQMRSVLQGTVAAAGGSDSLAVAGITLQRDGSLAIEEKRLAPLLEQPGQLAKLFAQAGTGASRGFAVRVKEWAQALTGDTGPLGARVEGLKHSAEVNQKQQDAQQDKLERTEQRLRAQYQRLDNEMTKLNAQMAQMRASLGLTST